MEMLAGFLSLGFLVLAQIVAAAFIWGRQSQTLKDACRRITALEVSVNGKNREARETATVLDSRVDEQGNRITRLEAGQEFLITVKPKP